MLCLWRAGHSLQQLFNSPQKSTVFTQLCVFSPPGVWDESARMWLVLTMLFVWWSSLVVTRAQLWDRQTTWRKPSVCCTRGCIMCTNAHSMQQVRHAADKKRQHKQCSLCFYDSSSWSWLKARGSLFHNMGVVEHFKVGIRDSTYKVDWHADTLWIHELCL